MAIYYKLYVLFYARSRNQSLSDFDMKTAVGRTRSELDNKNRIGKVQ